MRLEASTQKLNDEKYDQLAAFDNNVVNKIRYVRNEISHMSEEAKSISDNKTDDKIQQLVDILNGIEDNVAQLKLENFELKKF